MTSHIPHGQRASKYGGILADFWEDSPIIDVQEARILSEIVRQSGTPALEIGCGSGRLLVPLATEGLLVDGIEPGPELASLCRERLTKLRSRSQVHLQRLQSLALPRKYSTVYASKGVFQLITSTAEVLDSIANIRRVLAPGGTLAVSFVNLEEAFENPVTDWLPISGERGRQDRWCGKYLWRRVGVVGGVEAAEIRRAPPGHAESAQLESRIYREQDAVTLLRGNGFSSVNVVQLGPLARNPMERRDFVVIAKV